VYGQPDTWNGFWYVALAEQFRGSLSNVFGDIPAKIGQLTDLASSQMGLLTPLLVPAFLATARTAPRYALLTGSAMVITLLFYTSYANADIERYYLGPILWAWTWLGILAAWLVALVLDWMPTADAHAGPEGQADVEPQAAATPPRRRPHLTLANALGVAVAIAILVPVVSASSASRIRADRSHDTAAAQWLGQAMPMFAPNANVVSWWKTSTVLWYGQKVEGLRPDISIIDDRTILDQNLGSASAVIARYLGKQPVYLIRANSNDLGLVQKDYDLKQLMGSGSVALYEVVDARVANPGVPARSWTRSSRRRPCPGRAGSRPSSGPRRGSPSCRTSSPPTTKPSTSGASLTKRWGRSLPWPIGSRSSSSTTARAMTRPRSPTSSPRPTLPCAPSITR
jgi:hypothetical protein